MTPAASFCPYRGAGRSRPARIRRGRSRQRQLHPGEDEGRREAGRDLFNPEAHVRHALDFAARKGLPRRSPSMSPASRGPARRLARAAGVKPPVYRFMSPRLRLRLPAQAVCARGPSRVAGGRDALVALDDRRPHADVRPLIGETVRAAVMCASASRMPPWARDGQSRLGRGGRAAGARGGGEPATGADVRAALN